MQVLASVPRPRIMAARGDLPGRTAVAALCADGEQTARRTVPAVASAAGDQPDYEESCR